MTVTMTGGFPACHGDPGGPDAPSYLTLANPLSAHVPLWVHFSTLLASARPI